MAPIQAGVEDTTAGVPAGSGLRLLRRAAGIEVAEAAGREIESGKPRERLIAAHFAPFSASPGWTPSAFTLVVAKVDTAPTLPAGVKAPEESPGVAGNVPLASAIAQAPHAHLTEWPAT